MTTTAEPTAQVAGFPPGGLPAGQSKPAGIGAPTEAPAPATAQSRLIPFGCDEETRRRRAAGADRPRPRPGR